MAKLENNTIGVLGISFDISDRKKIEMDLQQAKEKAEVANEAKSEFLRNMEHQLRTPFSGVYSLVQLMCESETDPEKKMLLEETYKSAKEFLDLLNNIINFSRDQVDTSAVLSKKFDLKVLVEKAVTMEHATATYKHLELTCHYPSIPSIFVGDPYRIRRVILNLLSNAIKFTEKGRVELEVKLAKKIDDRHYILQLIVSDTGIGIPQDKQQLIYEKFYREHPANQNKYTGAGLGLYIVKELVDELEGEIEVVSSPGKGARFICTLPLTRPLIDEINDELDL
ncbi:MAG: HAMP domain-containing sensor histidine kinase [Gammaproteobacteria bacterium]|nr:HAMP domain-containing sensor histidine kinase [Gammaproteobacteria bacterium]